MALVWTNKTNDDYILPQDVNTLAAAIKDLENFVSSLQNAEEVEF